MIVASCYSDRRNFGFHVLPFVRPQRSGGQWRVEIGWGFWWAEWRR